MVAFAISVTNAYMNLPGKGRRADPDVGSDRDADLSRYKRPLYLAYGSGERLIMMRQNDVGAGPAPELGHGASVIASWDSERNELVHDDA
jgi:hypothetical protein